VAPTRREATEQEARALANPIRLRVLRLLRFEQLTNQEIADRLTMRPATTLHHVRMLLSAGFIEPGAERPGPNGITEKPYRDTTKSWTLSVGETGSGRKLSSAALEAFVAEVAEAGGKLQAATRQALNLNRASLDELSDRLAAVLDDFEVRDDPDGQPYAVFMAIHRRPTRRSRSKRSSAQPDNP
jgi:DNA-binding transcriptional ArsR family regulator